MQAMTKPTYTAIVQHAKNGKPAIVFVPTTKHTRLTAVDLMSYSSVDNEEKPMFLLQSVEEMEPFVSRIKEPMLNKTIQFGVGYLHEGLTSTDQAIVKTLFETGWIQFENAHTDYSVTDLLQMMGDATWPLVDNCGKCVILCHAPRKDYYRKFLDEAFPVESHLDHYLHDNINAEGVSHRHLSDHLSELVEITLSDLEASKCVAIEDDYLLSPLNLGMIASYYYISCTTIESFSSSLTYKTKLKGLLEILASASEYELLPIRPGEEELIRKVNQSPAVLL
ncbi:D -box ATP-dependent RNA helicase D 12-like [Olea europaea subsp. europaea]|uniref:D -box ATP-dependent RNA helicase D 12-like n=1 Tax=Olea europaea subsp. europaea TaxID=158383 RepID=A0A8S0U2E1_OLEEU|nr:D -box ATP-dependent RNA helicase D 12-like [Olea europaea subsp. europaea]